MSCPSSLRSAEGRREFFRQAREQMRRERESPEPVGESETVVSAEVPLELDADEIVGRGRQGRDAWLREGKRQLERHRWENPDPISRSRGERLLLAAERLESELGRAGIDQLPARPSTQQISTSLTPRW